MKNFSALHALFIILLIFILGLVYYSPTPGTEDNYSQNSSKYLSSEDVISRTLEPFMLFYGQFENKTWTTFKLSGYLDKSEGKIEGVEIAVYAYPNVSFCMPVYERITDDLLNRGFQIYNTSKESKHNCKWIILKNLNETYYLECSEFLEHGRLLIVRGDLSGVIKLVQKIPTQNCMPPGSKAVYYGPSPQKVISYTIGVTRIGESIPLWQRDWTIKFNLTPSNYILSKEGYLNLTLNPRFPVNTTANMGVFIYDNLTECKIEVEKLSNNLLKKGYQERNVPKRLPQGITTGRILLSKMLQKGYDAVYIECAKVMGYGRLIILKGKPEELEKLIPILSGNE